MKIREGTRLTLEVLGFTFSPSYQEHKTTLHHPTLREPLVIDNQATSKEVLEAYGDKRILEYLGDWEHPAGE